MVLFDLAARKFYLFGIVLWPQDLIYLAALLIICACTLFLSSALVGKLWCGFACPHTVFTEIFMWIERRIEGGRSARMRLDMEPASRRKLQKKAIKHGAWLLLAFWTGLTFVAYFTPIRALLQGLASAALGPWEWVWIALYGALAYVNGGLMREAVCRDICPYACFQSTLFDRDTLVVTYDTARGEPRGLRNRKSLSQNLRQGDCIDCTLCVQVCPTGSDIRRGLQSDCMGCAACIDACDLVMDKIGAVRGLIRYSTHNALARQLSPRQMRARILRPRVLAYAGMLAALCAAFAGSLGTRLPLKLDVMRDRLALESEAAEGVVANVYRLHIMNTDERAHRYHIAVSGIDTITLASPAQVVLEGGAARDVAVRVGVTRGHTAAGAHPIVFELQDENDARLRLREKAVFLVARAKAAP